MIIGITGGVGAGKSAVLSMLEELCNAFVIQADEIGHRLLEPGEENYKRILKMYGSEILNPDGTINKKELAARVFADEASAKRLNEQTHPVIHEKIIEIINSIQQKEQGRTIVIEAALLKEGGLQTLCDSVWYIYAQESVRIERIMRTRGYDIKRCQDLINRQKSDASFRAECDEVIDNNSSVENVREQLERLKEKYRI